MKSKCTLHINYTICKVNRQVIAKLLINDIDIVIKTDSSITSWCHLYIRCEGDMTAINV